MKTDLVLNPIDVSAPMIVEAAQIAEAVGFEAVWTYDHISAVAFRGRTVLDSWTVLAGIAASTTRIGVGPLVVNAVARHPAHVAVATAALQDLSGGRVMLGLGAGAGPESPYSRELSMVGLPVYDAATRRGMVADMVTFLRALWAGDEHFDAIAVPDPIPPIVIAANGAKMAALAGQIADWVNFHDWQPVVADLIDAACAAARSANNERFEVTIEAAFDDEWLRLDGARRIDAEERGVTRIMVRWSADLGLGAIERAGKLLSG
ncbi:MAG: LLM class flavin-dependent oxidoreductase [Actinobacteria bacterium]|nr:MAG: LLM class flavin-dependent oxidoreductase [Actinomycetota bacterium]